MRRVGRPHAHFLLYSIAEQPQSAGDLVRAVGVSQPTVSKHLQNLRERRLVTATRDGQNVIYSITDLRIIKALDLLRMVLADSLSYQGSLAEKVENPQITGGKA